MKKIVHTSAAILVMLCFGVSGLFYFFFDAAQVEFKVAAGEHVKAKSKLETVRIPLAEFRKNGSDDEVWIDGRLYDVSSYLIENDMAVLTVYHDRDEETLVKNVSATFDQNNSNTDNSSHFSKYRVHAPDDGKVLVAPFALSACFREKSAFTSIFFLAGAGQFSNSVIKPPPDGVLI